MSFGGCQDADNPSPAEWGEERFDEMRAPWWQFQEKMTSLLGQGQDIASEQTSQQVIVRGHLGARQHLDGNVSFGQHLLQLNGPPANPFTLHVAKSPELMGGGKDGVGTVSFRDASHFDGFIPRAGPVVESGEQMAVNVDQWVGACHSVTWKRIRGATTPVKLGGGVYRLGRTGQPQLTLWGPTGIFMTSLASNVPHLGGRHAESSSQREQ